MRLEGCLGGGGVGAVVLLVAGAARPRGLMGRVMMRPSTACWYEASCPRSYIPPKWIPPGGCTPICAPSAAASPTFFLVAAAQFPKGPPHPGTPRARKNLGLRPIRGTSWVGEGGQGFSSQGFPCPCPRVCR